MATTDFRDTSHYEAGSPRTSIHGARGPADPESSAAAAAAGVRRDSASSIDHVEEKVVEEHLTRRQKVRRHCGRFWLWYLIGSIIFLAIFLPVLFKVIVPAIVQDIVNKQEMPILGGAFLVLSPSQISVSIKTQLNTPLPASLDPVPLFLGNGNSSTFNPFFNITIPGQHVNGATDVIVTNQTVDVTNEKELITWFNDVFDQPKVKLAARGDASVHLGALQSNVRIEKVIELKALNKLSGFGITDLNLQMTPDANGKNVKGKVNVPNAGLLTLGLGDLTFNIMSGSLQIGYVTIYNALLPPGDNSCSFDGQIWLDVIFKNIGSVLASQAGALANGNIQLDAVGNSTVVNGQRIKFVEGVLNNKRLVSTMPVLTLLGDVLTGILGGGGGGQLGEIFGDVLGNSTFIQQVANHWNTTANGGRGGGGRSSKRNLAQTDLAWKMLKMGMKMKAVKH